jgi:hypothetical protein
MIAGTGKEEAELLEEVGVGLTEVGLLEEVGVGEVLTAEGRAFGNRRFQVAGPVIPSGVKPAACWN